MMESDKLLPEGNTRTTAVFIVKYLKTFGFHINNDVFVEHSWYFRNALARANYNDLTHGIHATTEYLEYFSSNSLINEQKAAALADVRVRQHGFCEWISGLDAL